MYEYVHRLTAKYLLRVKFYRYHKSNTVLLSFDFCNICCLALSDSLYCFYFQN